MDIVKFLLDLFQTLLLVAISFFNFPYKTFFPTRKSIKNQIALVTGSGSGLGRGIALKLSELGCTLVLVDVNQRTNNETGKMIRDQGGDCIIYTCDLSVRAEISILGEKVKKEVGDIEILVNNAGIVHAKYLDELSEEEIQKVFDVNIMAHFWLTKHFLSAMQHRNHGHIVNVASVAGFYGVSHLSDYCSSKFAVVGFTDSLREELRARNYRGVKTTLVCPFFIDTGMFDGFQMKYDFVLRGLKTGEVASEVIDAMLKDQEVLILPKRFKLAFVLKRVLPVKAYEALTDFVGLNGSFENFDGRKP